MRSALILLLVAASAAGCSFGDKQVPASEVESDIRRQYEEQTKLELEDLDCKDLDAKVGAPLSCSGRNERDVDLKIRGKVRQVKGDDARYRWDVVEAYAPGALYADAAKRQLETQVEQELKSLTCPDRILVKTGEDVRCELTAMDGKVYGVTLKLTNQDGAFDIKVDEQPKA